MVMVLSTIGRRGRLRPASPEPAVPLAKASLVPRDGMPMRLEARAA
jgi:hypothetical protein